MLPFATIFLFGLLLGFMIAVFLCWLIWQNKERQNAAMLLSSDLEKRQLQESFSNAQIQISALHERVQTIKDLREEMDHKSRQLDIAKSENSDLTARIASITSENQKTIEYCQQRINDLLAVHEHMKEAFSTISKDALLKNADMINASFKHSLDHFFQNSEKDRHVANENLANIMTPLKESLVQVEQKVQELETKRQGAYAGIKEQIDSMLKSQGVLQKETQTLAQALNAPSIRGRWGEMQLKRVVELSGMSAHCDFIEQHHISDGDENYRPDMVVTLPHNKKIVIDAKVPLAIFGDATTKEEERGQDLAMSIKRHVLSLKKKSYHSVVGDSPEFVVMFLPGESFLHWALLADPGLIDLAAQHEVIIATPITLVALLKSIAFGFRQEALANNIEEVRRLSQQLIDRIHIVTGHFDKLGKNLRQANLAYNQTLSSLDSRVLVTARKLAEIKSVSGKEEVVYESLPYLDVERRDEVEIEGELDGRS